LEKIAIQAYKILQDIYGDVLLQAAVLHQFKAFQLYIGGNNKHTIHYRAWRATGDSQITDCHVGRMHTGANRAEGSQLV